MVYPNPVFREIACLKNVHPPVSVPRGEQLTRPKSQTKPASTNTEPLMEHTTLSLP